MDEQGGQRWLTIDDIVTHAHVTEAEISPDGRAVAYVVAETGHVGKLPASSIWLADAEGGRSARRLTFGAHCDTAPRWSPDGTMLAFLSDRTERDVLRVHLLRHGIGDAEPLTAFPHGVATFAWAPDGQRIACVARQIEGTPPPIRDVGAADATIFEGSREVARLFLIPLAVAADVTPEPIDALGLHLLDVAWSPDGTAVVVAGTREPRIDEAFVAVQIVRISLTDGSTLALATTNGTQPQVRWSPDGAWIAYAGGAGRTYQSSALSVVPSAGGAVRCVTADADWDVFSFSWLPDSRGFIAAVQRDLQSSIDRIDLATGQAQPMTSDLFATGAIDQTSLSLSRDGGTVAVVRESDHDPRAVWIGACAPMRRLAGPAAVLPAGQLGEVRTLSWRGADGLEIRGAIVLPLAFDPARRYPLVVQIHGGPASLCARRYQVAWNEWGQLLARHGFLVLRPNPRGSGGRGLAFAAANANDLAGGDFDDILRGVNAAVEVGLADPNRLGVGGWSYGGYLSAWAATHSERFACAVVGAPVIDAISFLGTTDIPFGFLPAFYLSEDPYRQPEAYRQHSPLYDVEHVQAPVLLLHGEQDVRVPLNQSIQFATALRGRGKTVQLVTYPREGHAIHEREHQRDVLERVVGWFTTYLG